MDRGIKNLQLKKFMRKDVQTLKMDLFTAIAKENFATVETAKESQKFTY